MFVDLDDENVLEHMKNHLDDYALVQIIHYEFTIYFDKRSFRYVYKNLDIYDIEYEVIRKADMDGDPFLNRLNIHEDGYKRYVFNTFDFYDLNASFVEAINKYLDGEKRYVLEEFDVNELDLIHQLFSAEEVANNYLDSLN